MSTTCDAAPPPDVLHLPPVARSVPEARAYARKRLAGTSEDLLDRVELCVSELATNGVLHARTELEVRVDLLVDRVRLEISDSSPVVPRHVSYSPQATTGRGLDLVRALSEDWGVILTGDRGKSVWCELPFEAAALEVDEDALLAAWPDDLDEGLQAAHPPDVRLVRAVLLRYPVARGMRLREHIDATVRECLLVDQSAGRSQSSAPRQLVALAEQLATRYSATTEEPDRRRAEAFARGDAAVDLVYHLPPGAEQGLDAWIAVCAALDAHAEQHALLTLRTPPDLAELRDWTMAQLRTQVLGGPPTPWPGPLD